MMPKSGLCHAIITIMPRFQRFKVLFNAARQPVVKNAKAIGGETNSCISDIEEDALKPV